MSTENTNPAGGAAGGAATPIVPSASAALTTPPVSATPAPSAATAEWTSGFNDDLKGYLGNKGFKSAQDLAESYRNFEKLQGVPQDRILKLAEKFRGDDGKLTQEARSIYERLGAPSKMEDYQIEIPKDFGDQAMADKFRGIFHEEAIPKSAAERIVKEWNALQEQGRKSATEKLQADARDGEARLRRDWGQAYDQNLNIAREAARTLGMDAKTIDSMVGAIGYEATLKNFHKMGAAVGEGKFIQGSGPTNQVVDPVSAQSQIKELRNDRDFGKRLLAGDSEAKAKWQRLHEMAYPGQMAIRG